MPSSKNEKVNENEVNLDEVYDKIGQFGIYQLSILILVSFTATITSSTAYSVVFFAAQPEFRCKLPNYENDTYQIQSEYHKHLIDIFIPKDSKTQRTCQLKVYNNLSIDLITNTTSYLIEDCHDYVFSSEYYTNTVVTSWKLVCDREGIKSTFSSLYFFGYFAVVLVGLLGDAYGRKLISYIFIVLCAVAAILTAIFTSIPSIPVSVQIVLFAALRLILGIVSNVYIIGMVLVIELVGPKWRVTASNAFYYCYVLGEFITLAMGVAFKDYRAFNICLAVFLSLFVCYFWVVPESPRFLIIKSRRNEACQVLRCIAKSNRKEFDESFLDSNLNEIASNRSDSFNMTKIDSQFPLAKEIEKPREKSFARKLLIAFKSSTFRTRLIVTMINWFGNTFVYDGLSFNIGALGGNPYLNYVYGAIVELAGISASHFALEKIGRKVPYTVCLLLAGLSLVSIAVIPHHLTIVITVMALLGKFFISFTFNAVYVVTAEAYPTEIRNTAVSFCSAQSRIGGVIAPYVQLLGSLYWFPLPYLIYGASALVASISYIIFMPETKGKKLLDKLEDMES